MKLFESKETEFELELNIEGASEEPESIRLFLEGDSYSIAISGNQKDEKTVFTIPPIINLTERDEIVGHVEVVIDGKNFSLEEKTFHLERDIKLKAEINETKKPVKKKVKISENKLVEKDVKPKSTDKIEESDKPKKRKSVKKNENILECKTAECKVESAKTLTQDVLTEKLKSLYS